MLKKILVSTSCILTLTTGAFAEKLTQMPVDFEIYGTLKTLYKVQNNRRAGLLDSKDRFNEAGYEDTGNDFRHGANNRESQNVRANGEMTIMAKAGENDYEGTTWYNMIAVMQIKLDPKDPDNKFTDDGEMHDYVQTGDVWIRYAPHPAVGVTVGVQTVRATAPAAAIGHLFAGDPDSDFVFYTASVLDEKPGITFDFHLSKDIEFGLGQLQGIGDYAAIICGGDSEEATNNVAWFKGNFGFIEATVGYQNASVGGTETNSSSGIPNEWQHEYTHTLINYTIKANVGDFSPFYSVQQASGEKVSENIYATLNTALTSAGLTTLNNNTSGRDVEGSMTTVGIVAKLGDWGKIAAEYTKSADSAWGKEKSVVLATEHDYTCHINWEYEITESSVITLFYNYTGTKDDDDLREDIQTMQNNVAMAEALGMDVGSASDRATYAQLKQVMLGLESIPLTYDQSVGIQFTMTFGN